ncbi:hypothetical protein EV175_004689, partial [Coemansia sp. RSA 1933]
MSATIVTGNQSANPLGARPPDQGQVSYRLAARSSEVRNEHLGAVPTVAFSAFNLLDEEEVDLDAPPAQIVPRLPGQHALAFMVPPNTTTCNVSAILNDIQFEGLFTVNVNKICNFATIVFSNAEAVDIIRSAKIKIGDYQVRPVRLIKYKESIFCVRVLNTNTSPDPVIKSRKVAEAMSQFGKILEIELYYEAGNVRHRGDTVSLIMDIGDRSELPTHVTIDDEEASISASCCPITCNYCKKPGHAKMQCPSCPGNKRQGRPEPAYPVYPGASSGLPNITPPANRNSHNRPSKRTRTDSGLNLMLHTAADKATSTMASSTSREPAVRSTKAAKPGKQPAAKKANAPATPATKKTTNFAAGPDNVQSATSPVTPTTAKAAKTPAIPAAKQSANASTSKVAMASFVTGIFNPIPANPNTSIPNNQATVMSASNSGKGKSVAPCHDGEEVMEVYEDE